MNKIKVMGDESKMYCAKLRETLKARDTFICQHGEGALFEAAKVLGIKLEEEEMEGDSETD